MFKIQEHYIFFSVIKHEDAQEKHAPIDTDTLEQVKRLVFIQIDRQIHRVGLF